MFWSKKRVPPNDGVYTNLPAMVFDIEDVLAVVSIMEEQRKVALEPIPAENYSYVPQLVKPTEVVVLSPNPAIISERIIPLNEVKDLPNSERQHLRVRGLIEVPFHAGTRLQLMNDDKGVTALVADYLYRKGRRRVEIHRLRRYFPLFPLAVLVASWLWLAIAYPTPAPLAVAGTTLVFFAAVGTYFWIRSLNALTWKTVGTRFRESSLQDTRTRLANAKATLIVGLITAVIIGPIGVFVGSLIFGSDTP